MRSRGTTVQGNVSLWSGKKSILTSHYSLSNIIPFSVQINRFWNFGGVKASACAQKNDACNSMHTTACSSYPCFATGAVGIQQLLQTFSHAKRIDGGISLICKQVRHCVVVGITSRGLPVGRQPQLHQRRTNIGPWSIRGITVVVWCSLQPV